MRKLIVSSLCASRLSGDEISTDLQAVDGDLIYIGSEGILNPVVSPGDPCVLEVAAGSVTFNIATLFGCGAEVTVSCDRSDSKNFVYLLSFDSLLFPSTSCVH